MAEFSIGIEESVEEAIRDFGQISKKIRTTATVRAANRGAAKMRTEAGRAVKKIYYINANAVKKAARVLKASPGQRTIDAAVRFHGGRLPLSDFKPKPVAVNPWNKPGRRHKNRGGGVRVRIRRDSGGKVIQGAFITRAKSGHMLVLQRVGRNDPSVLASRRPRRTSPPGRYPVKELTTLDIPTAATSRSVLPTLRLHALAAFRKEFIRQLNFLVKKT